MEQLNIFGNTLLSTILTEIQQVHQFCYHIREKEEQPEYKIIKNNKNKNIQLCVFTRKKEGTEQIIAKSVYLKKTDNETYKICHFNAKCLPSLIDCRSKNILLECFVNQTEIIDDLEEN